MVAIEVYIHLIVYYLGVTASILGKLLQAKIALLEIHQRIVADDLHTATQPVIQKVLKGIQVFFGIPGSKICELPTARVKVGVEILRADERPFELLRACTAAFALKILYAVLTESSVDTLPVGLVLKN